MIGWGEGGGDIRMHFARDQSASEVVPRAVVVCVVGWEGRAG